MITNESLLFAKYFFSWSKIRKNVFKLNRLVGLIFGNIKFWRPIRPEGRQNLTEYQMDLKMVSKRPQRILMNLQLLFESVLLVIFVTNSVNVLGGALCAPPTLFRVKYSSKVAWPWVRGIESLEDAAEPNDGIVNCISPLLIACMHSSDDGKITVSCSVLIAWAICENPLFPQYPTFVLILIKQLWTIMGVYLGIWRTWMDWCRRGG
jgi:hypothetical protein